MRYPDAVRGSQVVRAARSIGLTSEPTTHDTLAHELNAFDRIWDELFPAEQARLTRLVVEKVTVMSDGIDLVLRTDGVDSVVAELVEGGIDYHREGAHG